MEARSEARKIIHVDMDCFYAAVETKHQPELAGIPLGIGGPPNSRSVLCTANYEARKYGVRSAMPSAQAARLCPQLVILPPNFALYKKESLAVREILTRFTSQIEPLSLDEAYLDVSSSPHFHGSATFVAQEIRRLIQSECGLMASAGVAPNKFLAKVASDWNKPNGLFVVSPQEVSSFVKNLAIEKIPGVGKVTARQLHDLGFRTCADLQKSSKESLLELFGIRGESLYRLARGLDQREVESNWESKSLSVEETYAQDLGDWARCARELPELYASFLERLNKSGHAERIRGHVVKIKFFDFQSTTHETSSRSIPTLEIFGDLMRSAWERRRAPVRLLGVGVRLGVDDVATGLAQQLPIPHILNSAYSAR